jgi:hypothetical protein
MSFHDEREDWDDMMEGDDSGRLIFADPGSDSALRAETENNPRNLPCPSCDEPNMLTPEDKRRGYQCDSCANRAERGFD